MADNRSAIQRYRIILIIASMVGLYILGTAARTMLTRADYWKTVSDTFVADSITLEANRGNIMSSDGKLMVASLPEYRIYMDYVVIDRDSLAREKAQIWRDTTYEKYKDSIAIGLHKIFPDKSTEWFKNRLEEGKRKGSHAWSVYPGWVTYIQYMECKDLPLFCEPPYKGGFYAERKMHRKKPYGSLASRTLGAIYRDSDAAKSGLEWCYDTILRGQNGLSHRTKVRNAKVMFVDNEPVNGHDLVTTIDATMQDIAEKAIVNKLKEVKGEKGVVILMEVATGDIKAMVSMTHVVDSATHTDGYYEIQNDAINALWEPGSTFKTSSIMVALEDGKIDTSTCVETGNGIYMMHGRPMKDHNWRKGGYGRLTVPGVLEQSSNIGVSRLIDDAYHDKPEEFVKGLYRQGVGISLGLPMGADPKVRMPNTDRDKGNWSKTALAWMSIGYETALPPISTVAFYNAIANGGKMVRPRFVKAEMCNGQIVREFPVEVIKQRICSERTLKNIQYILEKVVSRGLGKKAGNKRFHVSGKTGTAQVAKNGSYASRRYMVSFCGYFPSEAPKYSCIVCILKDGLPASGGGQCGPVFSEISQFVMNQGVYRDPREACDSTSTFVPLVSNGNMKETNNLLDMMQMSWRPTSNLATPWCTTTYNGVTNKTEVHSKTTTKGEVPSVEGMGARDAVFALQQEGLKVRLRGTGRVVEQSIPAGTKGAKGRTITLNLK